MILSYFVKRGIAMGLFDIFKKKKPEQIQHEEPSDLNPFDIDSIIGYVKTQKPDASATEVADIISKLAEPEEDQDHLTPEGDLPWGWYGVHEKEIKRYEAQYQKAWSAWHDSRFKSPTEQFAALEAFVNYMNRAKNLLAKKSECFDYWREELFTDDFLEHRSKELDDMRANIDTLKGEYEAKQAFEASVLPTLNKELLKIIKAQPGILQKDVYTMFDPIGKSYIQEKLYYAEKSKTIIREKSGNTYKLYIK